MSHRPFDAVVFDLFGTLVFEFERDAFHGSIAAMAERLGADPAGFLEAWNATAFERQTGSFATVEDNVRAICRSLGARAPSDTAMAEGLEPRAAMYRRWFRPRSGSIETLRELRARGYPVAMISMCAPDAPAMWRASALAPLVDVAVFSCEVRLRKPDPAIYLAATEGLGVRPGRTLYCGDGAYGELSGATGVGMKAYLLRDPSVDADDQLVPDREQGWTGPVVADLRELLDLLP